MFFSLKYLFFLFILIVSGLFVEIAAEEGEDLNRDGSVRERACSEFCVQNGGFELLKVLVADFLKEGWCSSKKIQFMMDLIYVIRPEVCVEIGAFTGTSVMPVLAALKYLGFGHMYAIDAWSNVEAVRYMTVNDPNYVWWSTVDMQEAQNQFNFRLNHCSLNSYCTVIYDTSERAVNQIPKIDYLHLDGNIGEEGCLLDIQNYLPKVNSGGYILLSNLFQVIDGEYAKMSSMWKLLDYCEIVCEIDNNTLLVRKN